MLTLQRSFTLNPPRAKPAIEPQNPLHRTALATTSPNNDISISNINSSNGSGDGNGKPTFESMPGEIRNMIYTLAVTNPHEIDNDNGISTTPDDYCTSPSNKPTVFNKSSNERAQKNLGLLRVSRQIRTESLSLYHACNSLLLHVNLDLESMQRVADMAKSNLLFLGKQNEHPYKNLRLRVHTVVVYSKLRCLLPLCEAIREAGVSFFGSGEQEDDPLYSMPELVGSKGDVRGSGIGSGSRSGAGYGAGPGAGSRSGSGSGPKTMKAALTARYAEMKSRSRSSSSFSSEKRGKGSRQGHKKFFVLWVGAEKAEIALEIALRLGVRGRKEGWSREMLERKLDEFAGQRFT